MACWAGRGGRWEVGGRKERRGCMEKGGGVSSRLETCELASVALCTRVLPFVLSCSSLSFVSHSKRYRGVDGGGRERETAMWDERGKGGGSRGSREGGRVRDEEGRATEARRGHSCSVLAGAVDKRGGRETRVDRVRSACGCGNPRVHPLAAASSHSPPRALLHSRDSTSSSPARRRADAGRDPVCMWMEMDCSSGKRD